MRRRKTTRPAFSPRESHAKGGRVSGFMTLLSKALDSLAYGRLRVHFQRMSSRQQLRRSGVAHLDGLVALTDQDANRTRRQPKRAANPSAPNPASIRLDGSGAWAGVNETSATPQAGLIAIVG